MTRTPATSSGDLRTGHQRSVVALLRPTLQRYRGPSFHQRNLNVPVFFVFLTRTFVLLSDATLVKRANCKICHGRGFGASLPCRFSLPICSEENVTSQSRAPRELTEISPLLVDNLGAILEAVDDDESKGGDVLERCIVCAKHLSGRAVHRRFFSAFCDACLPELDLLLPEAA